MEELILFDVYDIVLRSGATVSVHAQSLQVRHGDDGAIAGVDVVSYDGIASSLVGVAPAEVACVVRRREQGSIQNELRMRGKPEYLTAPQTIVREKR